MYGNKIDNVEYAFPGENYTESGFRNGMNLGMTLRDYYAGNAPEIPEWFGESPPVREYSALTRSGSKTPVIDNKEWEIIIKKYWMKRLMDWRWSYADEMIKARKDGKL